MQHDQSQIHKQITLISQVTGLNQSDKSSTEQNPSEWLQQLTHYRLFWLLWLFSVTSVLNWHIRFIS